MKCRSKVHGKANISYATNVIYSTRFSAGLCLFKNHIKIGKQFINTNTHTHNINFTHYK